MGGHRGDGQADLDPHRAHRPARWGASGAESLPGTGHFYDAPRRMLELAFSGVLDRPQSSGSLTEVDCGWMPYFAEQADDNYLRHRRRPQGRQADRLLPSEYMYEYFSPPSSPTLRDRTTATASASTG